MCGVERASLGSVIQTHDRPSARAMECICLFAKAAAAGSENDRPLDCAVVSDDETVHAAPVYRRALVAAAGLFSQRQRGVPQ